MSRRHQFSVIAQVSLSDSAGQSAGYRPVAAYHHISSYDLLPLHAARRFLDLIKQEENARIIRAELQEYENARKVPCPFISLLLHFACKVDLEDPSNTYISEHLYHGYNLEVESLKWCSSNDEITVFDVTDPLRPKYCFVSLLSNIPISAEIYAREHYSAQTPDEMESGLIAAIKALGEEKLITRQMLVEAWPDHFPLDITNQGVNDEPAAEGNQIPPLADLMVERIVNQCLTTDDAESLRKILWIPDKLELVKSAIRKLERLPMSLLTCVLDQEVSHRRGLLDLSGLSLSCKQVMSLIVRSNVHIIDLSNVQDITIDTTRKILIINPHLTRLNLYGTSVQGSALGNLVDQMPRLFYHMEALLHPTFFDRTIIPCRPAFSFIGIHGKQRRLSGASLPYFTPSRVVQCLADYLRPYVAQGHNQYWTSAGAGLVPLAVFSSCTRRSNQRWGERSISIYPRFWRGAIGGQGWVFALETPRILDDDGCLDHKLPTVKYSFLTTHHDVVGGKSIPHVQLRWRVHDLRSFLRSLILEGRPAPAESAVTILENILKSVTDDGSLVFELMKEEDIRPFMESVRESRYYAYEG